MADELDVYFITVPADGTSLYQLLDQRVSGILKGKARERFMDLQRTGRFEDSDEAAARLLCKS